MCAYSASSNVSSATPLDLRNSLYAAVNAWPITLATCLAYMQHHADKYATYNKYVLYLHFQRQVRDK